MKMMDLRELEGAEALVYARKSNPDPKNPGKSVADQTDVTVVRIKGFGATVIACLVDDGFGVTRHSKKKIREGFNTAISLIESRPSLRIIAMWSLSRSTRELDIYAQFINTCARHGVLLYIGGQFYDPDDWRDRQSLGYEAVKNEAEAAQIRENSMLGIDSSAKDGKPHGPNLYGYRRVYHDTTRALIRVEIVPAQKAVLVEAAERVLAGETDGSVVRDFNRRGLTRTRGGKWNANKLPGILTLPAYRGVRTHIKQRGEKQEVFDAVWPRIFDEATAEALNAHYGAKPGHGARATTAKYPLTGAVFCGRCEETVGDVVMYADQASRAPRGVMAYTCRVCKRARRAAPLESVVIEKAREWLADPAFRAAYDAPSGWNGAAEYAALQAEEMELDAAIAAGLSASRAQAIEARISPRMAELEEELERFEHRAKNPLPAEWPTDPDEERDLLRRLVRVTCHEARRGRNFDYSSFTVTKAAKE